MKTTSTFVLVLLLLALSACGSVTAPPLPTFTATISAPIQTTTRACSLLTQAEAEGILGVAVAAPANMGSTDKEGAKDEVTTCRYLQKSLTPEATPDQTGKQITLIVINHPTVNDATAAFVESQQSYGKNAETVGGLGERAFWHTTDKQLNVLRGDVWLIIIADSATQKGSSESAKQVASLVLGKLQ